LIIWLYTNPHYGHTYFTSPVNSFLFKTHCRFFTWENVCSLYIWWYKYPARIIITFQTFKQLYINVNTLNIYLLFIWGKVCLRRNRVQYVYMYILVCQPFVCIVDGNIKVLFNIPNSSHDNITQVCGVRWHVLQYSSHDNITQLCGVRWHVLQYSSHDNITQLCGVSWHVLQYSSHDNIPQLCGVRWHVLQYSLFSCHIHNYTGFSNKIIFVFINSKLHPAMYLMSTYQRGKMNLSLNELFQKQVRYETCLACEHNISTLLNWFTNGWNKNESFGI